MKYRIIIILAIALFLSSCYSQRQYSRTWLGDIPAGPPTPVEVVYPEDPLPQKEYVEIVKIELALKGHMDSKRLVQEIKVNARREGVDGIIIQDRTSESFVAPSFGDVLLNVVEAVDDDPLTSGGYISTHYYQIITGIGIKYVENLNYITNLVKNEDLFVISDTINQPVLLARIDYYPSGSVKEFNSLHPQAEQLYIENIKNYADYYLLRDQSGHWHEWYDSENRLLKREKYRLEDWMLQRVRLFYDLHNRIQTVRIRNNEVAVPFTEIIINSWENNRVKSRKIKRHQGPDLLEKMTYDNSGKLVARDIYEVYPDGERHRFKSIFSHYLPDDIKDIVSQKKTAGVETETEQKAQ